VRHRCEGEVCSGLKGGCHVCQVVMVCTVVHAYPRGEASWLLHRLFALCWYLQGALSSQWLLCCWHPPSYTPVLTRTRLVVEREVVGACADGGRRGMCWQHAQDCSCAHRHTHTLCVCVCVPCVYRHAWLRRLAARGHKSCMVTKCPMHSQQSGPYEARQRPPLVKLPTGTWTGIAQWGERCAA